MTSLLQSTLDMQWSGLDCVALLFDPYGNTLLGLIPFSSSVASGKELSESAEQSTSH